MSDAEVPPTPMPPEPLEPFDERWFQIEGAVSRYLNAQLKSSGNARDALHEVYLQMRKCSDTATILHLESYALTVAKHIAARWRRDRTRHMRLNMRFLEQQSAWRGDVDERTPERICDGQQEFERATQALDELPPETQRICEADVKGEAIKAIAERLSLKLQTVYRRLRTTRQWLRDKLGLAGDSEP